MTRFSRTYTAYDAKRYWLLHELRRVRAAWRIGNMPEASAKRERTVIQKSLCDLRVEHRVQKTKGV